MCISKPHLMLTTHMSTPGSNAFHARSVSIRLLGFPDLTVGCPPPQLLEPNHCPRTGRVLRPSLDEASLLLSFNDSYGDPRSSTGTWPGRVGSSAAALPNFPSQVPRIHATARRICAAIRRARSPALPVEETHRESPPGRQSQPRGVRAHGALPEVGNRCGAGTVGDCRPFPLGPPEPQLSVRNEATPCGESPDGTTPRIRTATRPRHLHN